MGELDVTVGMRRLPLGGERPAAKTRASLVRRAMQAPCFLA